ncbi:energy-coupling factor ABC transporter permease [Oscillochloris sp. ZM17-4]|uniref:energy-coupling factor ABC transporter permease n=1 Tax=Oscillochloris sp. ZM17-4 TaxID=2866714 RepID=UPI001C733DF4|nr:energy-coupling factor ABC transporter permease [Oscillochloris sp. ZM17-4]MBX0330859.1 energy-coupling factor ABC transporter permease [Oscillochloris sp. ZM17-4]
MNLIDLAQRMQLAMHIPDGFLSVPVALAWWALTIVMIGIAVRQIGDSLNERQIPLMGVMAAFIFAAQMLNFPVLGGTSGHLLGGALAALLLGPWAGILVMSCVIALQALLFQDGGLLALGANIFNMGIATAAIGYFAGMPLLRLFGGKRWGLVVAGFITAWLSVMVAATLTSVELVISGLSAAVVFPAMLFVHMFIGIGEGLITVAALAFVVSTRPDLAATLAGYLSPEALRRPVGRGSMIGVTGVGLLIAVGAALLSPLASASPDGLERVAEDKGFLDQALGPVFNLLPDYTIPGLDGPVSTILAGIIGLLIVFALVYGVSLLLRGRGEGRAIGQQSGSRSGD